MNLENNENSITIISNCISTNNNYEDALEVLTNAISNHLTLSSCSNILELLQHTDKISNKKFLAITLLRFYKNHNNAIDNNQTLKRKVTQLFDEIFEKELYKKLDINKNTQTHIKIPRLINYLEEAELIKLNIDGLSKVNKLKQDFYKYFKGQYKNIITPFLETRVFQNMSKVFDTVTLYNSDSNLATYNETIELLEQNISICKIIDSEYNNNFLLKPLEQILQLIRQDFDKNPDSKPSKLIISSTGKKYPLLSSINNKFNLIIQIKNIESGKAYNTKLLISDMSENISMSVKEQFLGKIEGSKTVNIEFETEVLSLKKTMEVSAKVFWENYDGEEHSSNIKLIFYAQRTDINWHDLKVKDAYSIRAVENEDKLIGRKDILDDLHKGLTSNINSYYIHGQKRVGKTSIVKTLKSKLEIDKSFIVTYIVNTGTSAEKSIQNLGKKICKEIKRQYKRELRDIEAPIFIDNIDPLEDFLDDVNDELGDKKFIFILDEFDEMSSGLYRRNDLSNAFFLAIRNFASHDRLKCSFILVGGEKISFLMSIHGKHLNFFNEHRVDYFDKEHLNQFKELVQKPVSGYIDITDEAIENVYVETAGNPYFTNLICKEMLNIAIEKKDSHITDKEMIEAIEKVIYKAEKHIFIHFWEDGIRELQDESIAEETSYKRRSVLLALSSLLKAKKLLKQEYITDKLTDEFNESETKRILKEFVDRKILIEENEIYSFRINFFKKWLVSCGSEKIIMTLSHEQQIQKRAKEEKEAKITSQEVKTFIDSKNIIYNGKPLSPDDVRNWIEQFGDNLKQRLIFNILEKITYYRDSNIKDKMKTLYQQIKKMKIIPTIGKKTTHILVSYLDQVGKSSAEYAKYFGEENSIHSYNIVEKSKILDKINDKEEIKVLVFIDDFIGTGNSIIEYTTNLKKDFPDIFKKEIDIYIGVITGFQEAKERIESEFEKLNIKNIKIILIDPLNERDKCFSENSKIFSNPDKRREAKDICEVTGQELVSKNPLGYGNCQATVIFPETCPNNCLPILWESKKGFNPLFPRKK